MNNDAPKIHVRNDMSMISNTVYPTILQKQEITEKCGVSICLSWIDLIIHL